MQHGVCIRSTGRHGRQGVRANLEFGAQHTLAPFAVAKQVVWRLVLVSCMSVVVIVASEGKLDIAHIKAGVIGAVCVGSQSIYAALHWQQEQGLSQHHKRHKR